MNEEEIREMMKRRREEDEDCREHLLPFSSLYKEHSRVACTFLLFFLYMLLS